MASFIYNAHKNTSYQSQWKDYLQKSEFHSDLNATIRAESKSIRNAVSDSTFEIVGTLDDGFGGITNSLEAGFSKVSQQVENLSIMLDWRLSTVIHQLKISNLLQENIALLLRVPDFQKERQYFIEQGFKHYKNARFDNDLYEDSLKNLLEAEKRETTDYVVLHLIGMIYLYSSKLLDIAKAEDYFRRAAKYSVVESNPEAQRTLNILSGNVGQNLSANETLPKNAKVVAANSYFQAGISCYAQGKFAEANELSEKAFNLSPYFLEAGFLLTKTLVLLGDSEKAAEILQGIIKKNRYYAVKTVLDGDLWTKSEIQKMLGELRNSAVLMASENLANLTQQNVNHPQFKEIIFKIDSLVQKNTFFDAFNAIEALNTKYFWEPMPFVNKMIKVISEAYTIQKNSHGKDYKNLPESVRNLPERMQRKYIKAFEKSSKVVKQADETGKNWRNNNDFLNYLKTTKRTLEEYILFEKEINRMEEEEKRRLENEAEQNRIKQKEQELAAELKRQTEEENRQKQIQLNEFLNKAKEEDEIQNKKWMFKNYDLAIYYYEEAAKLGSNEAKQRLQYLRKS